MKNFIYYSFALLCLVLLSGCHAAEPDADSEAVLTKKPWIFGKGGVDPEPVKTGLEWCVPSTDVDYVKIVPIAHVEDIQDAVCEGNTPLDWNIQITMQVIPGKSPILLQNYGKQWYENNIHKVFTSHFYNIVGNYDAYSLMSERVVTDSIEAILTRYMTEYIDSLSKRAEFPVRVCNVTVGKAKPNDPLRNEMDQTAAIGQQKKSNELRIEAEKARGEANKQRAIADKAYMNEMNLSQDQFIQLRAWEIIEKKSGANIDVLFDGSANKMWNVRR